MDRRAFITSVAAVLVAPLAIQGYSAGVANPAATTVRRVVSERMLAPVGGLMGRLTERIRISPDGRHVAFVAAGPNGGRVYLDGKAGPGPYTLISDPQFSPNSARLAYAATTTQDRTTLVVDGVEGPWYDVIKAPWFSPDSARIAYVASTRMPAPVWRKWQVVIDGTPSAPFEAQQDPYIIFSPDSRRVAYVYGPTADQAVTVLDGQPISLPGYDSIGAEFFPNGVAYRARKGGKSFFLLINGREVAGPYRQIGFLTFSSDGKRTAYSMMEDACAVCSQRAVVDGAVGPPYFGVNKVIFSPDGTRWAYQALKRPYDSVVVLDGREYAQGSDPVFSPDSRRIGLLRQSRTPPGVAAVVDGQEGRPYQLIRQLVFSPDSQHFAYGADRGQNLLLVVDGSERKEYPRAADSTPLVIPTFSPDSRHVLSIAPIGNSQAVVVDENEGNLYDKIMSMIVFDSPTRFHYIARKSNGFYLVEEELVEIGH